MYIVNPNLRKEGRIAGTERSFVGTLLAASKTLGNVQSDCVQGDGGRSKQRPYAVQRGSAGQIGAIIYARASPIGRG
jgi:hypothetical protein